MTGNERITGFRFDPDRGVVWRRIAKPNRRAVQTAFAVNGLLDPRHIPNTQDALADLADAAFLRKRQRPRTTTRKRSRAIRIADLFSGCGFMTLGVTEAIRALGYKPVPVIAFDTDERALKIFSANFPGAAADSRDIRDVLRGTMSARVTPTERSLRAAVKRIDIAIAGPPCQGHSDLNNYTRRHDPKNGLYYRVARFAKIVRPTHLIIENVPAVLHDKGRVVGRTRRALQKLGYKIDDGIVRLSELGVPQTRRRHVMMASLTRALSLGEVVDRHRCRPRSVPWAIGDLRGRPRAGVLDTVAKQTDVMARRIRYLFDHGRYELPNHQRPACHRDNNHTYKSVYGRLRWREPAQTITSGFMCMGQGRFVHPSARRTLTPREAARLQFIPDFFGFGDEIGLATLTEMIGNAVPPRLTYILALELLR